MLFRITPSFTVISITPLALNIGANAITDVQRGGSAERAGRHRERQ
jgi:hypothetical protein